MYAVGDTHSHMSPVGDGGGEEELCHVRSGGCSVTHVPSGDGGGEELWYVRSGGCSVTHVPSGGWWRRGGSVSCTQWGMISDTSLVGDGGGEEDLCHVRSGGWGRRRGALPCMQWEILSDTCP